MSYWEESISMCSVRQRMFLLEPNTKTYLWKSLLLLFVWQSILLQEPHNPDRDTLFCLSLCWVELISRNHSLKYMEQLYCNPDHYALCGRGLISRNQIKRHLKSQIKWNLKKILVKKVHILKHLKKILLMFHYDFFLHTLILKDHFTIIL